MVKRRNNKYHTKTCIRARADTHTHTHVTLAKGMKELIMSCDTTAIIKNRKRFLMREFNFISMNTILTVY